MKPLEKRTTKWLKKRAWQLFSEYIRKRDKGVCFTCGIKKKWKDQHAGHFKHGSTKAGYFSEVNVNCQCPKCNTYLSGNLGEYAIKMASKHGLENFIKLKSLWEKDHIFTREEFINIIKKYEIIIQRKNPIT